jgi:small-conductance mechanosensitive channel
MKPVLVLVILILAVLTPVTVMKQRSAATMQATNAQLQEELKTERDKIAALSERPDVTADELARLKEGNAELIKLRGEVNTLKRERDEFQKKVASLEAAAARAKQVAESANAAQKQAQEAQVQQGGNPAQLGAHGGALRRKILAGQPLTPEEQQSVANMQQNIAALEKSPAEFAQYQSAYVSSVLGWNNDARSQQLQSLLTSVAQAANNRGLTFNAPGQGYENWGDAQKALDNRATGAVKKMLTPEEVAVFDKALVSALNANPASAPRAP